MHMWRVILLYSKLEDIERLRGENLNFCYRYSPKCPTFYLSRWEVDTNTVRDGRLRYQYQLLVFSIFHFIFVIWPVWYFIVMIFAVIDWGNRQSKPDTDNCNICRRFHYRLLVPVFLLFKLTGELIRILFRRDGSIPIPMLVATGALCRQTSGTHLH